MALDRIKALLQKANVSPELASSICEAMEDYKRAVQESADQEVSTKIKAAKKVIKEEIERYKDNLARQVQLFCESKSQTVEQQLMRKSAAGEAEAATRLQRVAAVVEGVQLDGKPNSKLKAKLAESNKTVSRLNEQLKAERLRAARSTKIAESMMEKNRLLIQENKKLGNGMVVVQEGKDTKAKAPANKANKIVIPTRKTAPVRQISESANTTTGANLIDVIAASM